MYLVSSISFLAILFSLFSNASGCKSVVKEESLSFPECVARNSTYVRIDGRRVPAGSKDVRIQLEEPSTSISISCGSFLNTITWENKELANQVRVRYIEGKIVISAFWCDSFDGPKEAGIRCAIEAFARACPGRVGIDNHTCVYEVVTSRFSSNTVRKTTEVKAEVAVAVRNMAIFEGGVFQTEERTVVKTHMYNGRSYIVIPAGYTFCSFSIVESIEEHLASTGFKWQCQLPRTFVQLRRIDRCSPLKLCENQAPCLGSNNQLPDVENKSVVARPVAMLIVLCMIVLNIIM